MARKSKGQSQPKKGAASKAKAKAEPAVQASSQAKRALKAQNTDTEVNKRLYDNFTTKGWSAVDLDDKLVDGLTLRERITTDLRVWRVDKSLMPMGKPYYDTLKAMYRPDGNPIKKLQETLKGCHEVAPDPALRSAIGQAINKQAMNKMPLMDFCENTQEATKVNIVAVGKYAWRCKPSSSTLSLTLCTSILGFFARLGVKDKHPDVHELMSPWFDKVLLHTYNSMKLGGQDMVAGAKELLANRSEVLGLVVDTEKVKSLVQPGIKFANHAETLHEVVSSSKTGEALFGSANTVLVDSTIQQHIDTLAGIPLVTAGKFKAAQADCINKIVSFPDLETLPAKRRVTLLYRGVEVPYDVSSPGEEVRLKFATFAKSIAVDHKQLEALWCEGRLVTGRAESTCKLEDAVVVPYRIARKAAKEQAADALFQSGEVIKEMLRLKSNEILAWDATFVIEKAFFTGMVGQAGEDRLRSEMSDCLPSKDWATDLTTAHALTKRLLESNLGQFTSGASQGKLKVVVEQLNYMKVGDTKNINFNPNTTNAFMKEFIARVPFFVRRNHGGVDHFGQAALKMQLEDFKSAVAAKKADLDHTHSFYTFKHLLTDEQFEEVGTLVKQAVADAEAAAEADEGDGAKEPEKKKGVGKGGGASSSSSAQASSAAEAEIDDFFAT